MAFLQPLARNHWDSGLEFCFPGAEFGWGRGFLLRCECHGLVLAQDGQEDAFEKWRVENSWGEDRGNKGNL